LLDLLYVGIVGANYLCGLACVTSCSRMMYAFARDDGLPFSKALSNVTVQHRVPTVAVWVSAALAFLSCLYGGAFIVLAAGCAVFLYISYIMPVAAGIFAEGKNWKEKGPFNLGALSKPNAVLAIIGGLVLTWVGFQPPNALVGSLVVLLLVILFGLWSKTSAVIGLVVSVALWAGNRFGMIAIDPFPLTATMSVDMTLVDVVVAVLLGLYVWFLGAGESVRFEGIPQGEKIAQRQGMIADIEARYNDSAAD
jgi:hypothetical protein